MEPFATAYIFSTAFKPELDVQRIPTHTGARRSRPLRRRFHRLSTLTTSKLLST